MTAKDKSSMLFYHDWIPLLEALDQKTAIEIVISLLRLDRDGTEPELKLKTPLEQAVFNNMVDAVRRNREAYEQKCEKNKQSGSKGGRPKKRTVSEKSERFSEKPNGFLHQDNDNDNDYDKDKDIDNDTEKDKDKGYDKDFNYMGEAASDVFVPPTVGDIEVYCTHKGINVDAEAFVDFYTSKGWMIGKNKMTDWTAAVRNWARNSNNNPGQKGGDGTWAEDMKGW